MYKEELEMKKTWLAVIALVLCLAAMLSAVAFADSASAADAPEVQAAANGAEWQGEVLSASSPVRGVSYWDALAYANFVKGRLVSAPLLEAVRYEVADESVPEEWTTTQVPASSVYAAGYVVLPPAGSPIVEPAPTARRVSRGFRVAFPVSTQSD
jgi:hypothetical protein